MSVLDPIQLGNLTLTPSHFTGEQVQVDLVEATTTAEVPGTAKVLDTNGGQSGPMLSIRTWETLQAAATELAAYAEARKLAAETGGT